MAFHLHENWYFERMNGGKPKAGVRIYRAPFGIPEHEVTMTLDDWISVITEMAGGSAEAHAAAKALYLAASETGEPR